MKKILRMVIICVMVTLLCVSTVKIAFAGPNIQAATSDFYVNDFANVFSQEEKNQLMTSAVNLANEHNGVQVVVTTVKSLEGDSIENYAYNMYNQYSIGKEDMGLLILLATEDRQIRVEVGRAMESYINDAKAGRFIDEYAIPYLSQNKFNEGLTSLQSAFIQEIKSCVNKGEPNKDTSGSDIDIDLGKVILVILGVAAIGGIAWGVFSIVNIIRKKREEQQEYIAVLNSQIATLKIQNEQLKKNTEFLNKENERVSNKLETATNTLASVQNRYERILLIYPDADTKVDEMIAAEKIAMDRAAAEKVDELIDSVINLNPDKDLVSRLSSIKNEVDCLNRDERKYLKSNMERFNSLYSKCCALKREYDEQVERERRQRLTESRKQEASEITKQLLGIISIGGIVKASDLSKLKNAKRLYEDLDSETKSYVDTTAISKTEELLKKAKRAKEEEEAERRRRKQTSYSSSSSYRSSSSAYRGFGGRSGGGGASRRF